jgi:glycine cleavage system H lipoate-binding protein
MTCPFLKEAQVKFCRTAAVRKLIPLAGTGRAEEKCSSPAHASCPVYHAQLHDSPASATCPYLDQSLMQYCGAAPVAKFVPYSESLLSRCGNDGFRYCELFLSMAHPREAAEEGDSLAAPDWLQYSANHMWLDVTEDGACHAGIDAFLGRALGRIDRISYVWLKGRHRPAAVLTVDGVDLELVFPNPFLLTSCNLYLRADPSRITEQPYRCGWLFEGVPDEQTLQNLVAGPHAIEWMDHEQRRMSEFLQQQEGVAADGGMFTSGVARHLDRDRRRALFHEFFLAIASGELRP